MDWQQRCAELQQRIAELEAENRELRRKLGLPLPSPVHSALTTAVHMHSTPAEKIKLFRSLFRGREDVFARRWYSSKTEKAGYAPVCANEWKHGICIKPNATCSKCAHRELVPLSDRVIYDHLSGKDTYGRDVVGLYPILPDDTCYFLAIDFDDGAWQENSNAVRNVCNEWGIPCAVERSRSGEGAHLWIFFSEPLPCSTARKLGSALLTATMEREGTLKLDAYDRMFPCQDTLPSGGFGNLIALPLQGKARKKGNSVFVDESFVPYVDFRIPMLERMYHKRLSGYASIGYTVRGSKAAPATDNRIFTQVDYWPVFSQDIRNSQKEIQIVAPYLHTAQVKRFLALVPEDVKVTVNTGDEGSFKSETWQKVKASIELLQSKHVQVICTPKVYQRSAVIDRQLIWYGGINYLGFEKAAQGAMRLSSTELAKELTDSN